MPIEYKKLLEFQTAKALNWMKKVRLGSFPFFDNVRGVTGFDIVSD